jgi:hypothetical protein
MKIIIKNQDGPVPRTTPEVQEKLKKALEKMTSEERKKYRDARQAIFCPFTNAFYFFAD